VVCLVVFTISVVDAFDVEVVSSVVLTVLVVNAFIVEAFVRAVVGSKVVDLGASDVPLMASVVPLMEDGTVGAANTVQAQHKIDATQKAKYKFLFMM